MLHLDTAAAGRASEATLAATAEHALLEAQAGGYVAEERAQGPLAALRQDVADLLSTDTEGVAFVESATVALQALLSAWPLRAGARVGVAASSWGPNLELLAHHGLLAEALTVDGAGVLDIEDLDRRLRVNPPDVVLVDQVAAHRGLVQPAQELVEVCRAAGVPVWVDAAQSLGHVKAPTGADAVFATSRKWLSGPRGVGMLAVAPEWRTTLDLLRPAKIPDLPPVRYLESGEAHIAGRVGLGVAVRELLDHGVDRVTARLVEVGAMVRESIAGVEGWEVVQPGCPAGSTTAIAATRGQDVAGERSRLLQEHGIVTSLCLPWRAPLEMGRGAGGTGGEAWLRISPHVDLTAEDLDRLCGALTTA